MRTPPSSAVADRRRPAFAFVAVNAPIPKSAAGCAEAPPPHQDYRAKRRRQP
ncbi:hypothetical protein [uncultured Phenylobacterium sp.]|uniref:hypothetical protein n=1 Tax=uncultured Phenylobacterium sp. TaxID=349273 RepID=UPI0025F0380F|nr:hypothetical protein [uncultured Phenylobacterium sp.]